MSYTQVDEVTPEDFGRFWTIKLSGHDDRTAMILSSAAVKDLARRLQIVLLPKERADESV